MTAVILMLLKWQKIKREMENREAIKRHEDEMQKRKDKGERTDD